MMKRLRPKVARSAKDLRAVELHRRLSLVMLLGVLVMIPWAIYLSIHLPVRFGARNWDVAWVGFDSALIAVLAAAAWAAWNRRQILAATSIVAATMLLCDAWFDVSTSMGTRDQSVAILGALLVNVPLVIFFILLARRIMLRTAAVLAAALSAGPVPHRAHDVAMPFATTWREQEIDNRSLRNL
jgi:hypothetical protein